ncbi:serine hydrolase domain-containing protein [Cohnella lupini]|uniref:CubicO group peptidase (Beta-lactamase class C family) n=1 Tax=Cohnella lupini TaxID=1294267 RepID=A0A3D9I093_9BACL|nr:serine hydrolase [Cohnella lupini]RED55070.1 CubicO group peptidase (beta-lactamase class C family) [Cohnella lupini]
MGKELKLPRSKPEEQGVASRSVLDFIDGVEREKLGLHSFILLRHGQAVAEGWWSPYERELPHLLFSLSKSFTSTAIGLAAQEGKLSLDDLVISYFPEETTEAIASNMGELRIRHLLSMSTGHATDTMPPMRDSENWAVTFLSMPIEHPPGTHFLYNTGATYMLSVILYRATGEQLLDFLQPRLFDPLRMTDMTTIVSPQGIHVGGFGISARTEDVAKLGQLYLQRGIWDGARILSEEWVEEATSKQVSNGVDPENDWEQGYGYQFWRSRHGYRGDGAFGQYCVVLPEQDAVIAITSGLGNMGKVLDLAWEHLLPGMKPEAIPIDEAEQSMLTERLKSLAYAPANKSETPSSAERWSGQTYSIESNPACIETLAVSFVSENAVIRYCDHLGEHSLTIGNGEWIKNVIATSEGDLRVATGGAWTDDQTYEVTTWLIEMPFKDTWTFRFEGNNLNVAVERELSVIPGLSDFLLLPDLKGSLQ